MCETQINGAASLPEVILWGGPCDGDRYGTVLIDPHGRCPEWLFDNYRLAAASRHLTDGRLCRILYVWREVWAE